MMNRAIALISAVTLTVLVSSFQWTKGQRTMSESMPPVADSVSACENEVFEYVYTSSERYKLYCDTMYETLFKTGQKPSRKVFDYAMKGYAYLAGHEMLGKKDILAFIDYSLSSNIKRLWVVDLKNVALLYHELVAHGRNSGEEYARKFSNAVNSYQTSLGFYVTGEIYNGKHELSIKMNGVERRYNGKAFDRGIVMHGADYVSEQFIRQHQRLGRSLGCPAVSQDVISRLSSTISNGVCLFAYYPHKSYLKTSEILKSDVVMALAK
jgi:hypothetical protein